MNVEPTGSATPAAIPEETKHVVEAKIATLECQIKAARTLIKWLKAHREQVEAIGIAPTLFGTQIDFDHANREQVLKIIKTFPGTWKKSLNANKETMDYVREIEGQPTLRIWSAELPPSCKLVEEWVDVPAQPATRVKKLVVKCKPDEPAPVAETEPQPA